MEGILSFVADTFFASKEIGFIGVRDVLHRVKTLSAQGRSASLSALCLSPKHLTSLRKTPCAVAQNETSCKSMTFLKGKAIV